MSLSVKQLKDSIVSIDIDIGKTVYHSLPETAHRPAPMRISLHCSFISLHFVSSLVPVHKAFRTYTLTQRKETPLDWRLRSNPDLIFCISKGINHNTRHNGLPRQHLWAVCCDRLPQGP